MAPLRRQIMVALAVCLLLAVQVSLASACTVSDRAALLAFKKGTQQDSTGLLDTWVEGGDCCIFYGVTCNVQGRVVELTIRVPPLREDCDGEDVICPNLQRKTKVANLVGTTLSKLSALEALYLGNVGMIGDVTPTGLSALPNLQMLRLEDAQYAGALSADIGRISSLKYLSFARSTDIFGPIDAVICRLLNLETLDLSGTKDFFGLLNGTLPSCIGNLHQLQTVNLQYNDLTGPLPTTLSALKKLQELRLGGNEFSGLLPNLPGLSSLKVLHLDGNLFQGTIPASYGSLGSLVELRLGGLDLPGEVSGLFSRLQGEIPSELTALIKLQLLVIRASKVSGGVPDSIGNLVNLVDLQLDHNQLQGKYPDLSKLTKLVTVNLDGNFLH